MSSRSHTSLWCATVGWRAPRAHTVWGAAECWAPSFDRLLDVRARALREALALWDARLLEFGGDPCRTEWSRFRPLRLGREEDWSDWLAHLLEQSASGRFSARLFTGYAIEAPAWKVESADREVVAGGYRADLVVNFEQHGWAHVEVKVGDLSLKKTVATCEALRQLSLASRRAEFLILPEEHVRVWHEQLPALGEAAAQVEVRTWHDVAYALRASVIEADAEPLTWRAWAVAFLGAVEQCLLES